VKVVLVGPTYPFRGGIAHYTTMLYHELAVRGHQVTLYSFKRQYPRWLFPGQTDRDPSVSKLDAPCEYTLDSLNPFTWWATARAIRRSSPAVLILQWWVSFFAPIWNLLAWLARRAEIKVVFICHNVLPHEQQSWDAWLARWALRQANGFIVQSQEEKARLLTLLPGRPVEIVLHPIYDMFAQQAIPQDMARQRLGLPQHAAVLLFFGFVREYKGLRVLLEAMPAVRARLPDIRLLIAGEFWQDKQTYLDQIKRLGIGQNVVVVDSYISNEEVPVYFSAADVLVLPYTQVTQSGVVQLAFGFGLPVITTQTGGLSEIVTDCRTGLLVPPQDTEALEHAICRFFVEGLGMQLGAGIRAQRQNFGWARLATAIERFSRDD